MPGNCPARLVSNAAGELGAGLLVPTGDHVERRGAATGTESDFGEHRARSFSSAALGMDVRDQVHVAKHYRYGYVLSIPFREFTAPVTARTIALMDAKTCRTENIRRAVVAAGGPAEFARRYGGTTWTQAQISQWISATNPKGIGHRLARDIEIRTGMAPGSLDRPFAEASQTVGLDVETMRTAARFLEDLFAARGKTFVASERIALLQAVYVELVSTGTPNLVALTTKYGKQLEGEGDGGQIEARGARAAGRSGNRRSTGKA